MANRTSRKPKTGFRTFKPTPAFQKKEEKVRQSILLETKEKLRNDMKKIFKDPQFSDLVLVSHSNELPVHSFILEARFSEFFNYIQSQPESRKFSIPEKITFANLEQWVETLYSEEKIDRTSIEEALTLNKEKSGMQSTDKDASLCTDLLSLLNGTTTDVEFSVQGKCIRAHKAILAARCDYFAAMFSSSWREESSSSITMPDVNSEIFLAALKFIYGASQDILSFPASKVLALADMYGLQDLVDLVVIDLQVTKCHLFHKPCTYCIPQVYDCLKVCEPFYHTQNFQLQCIQWIGKNFQKTLVCRNFPQVPVKFQNGVQQEIHKQLSSSTVALTWLKCNTLLASLKNLNTSWTQPVVKFVEEIHELCLKEAVEHFRYVCELPTIAAFFKEANNSSPLLEQFLNETLNRLAVSNCCYVFQGLEKLVNRLVSMDESERHYCSPFDSDSFLVIQEALKRCEKFIIGRIGPVSKTQAWKEISTCKQQELKSSAFFVDL